MTGLTLEDIAEVEINEAFASVPLAWGCEHGPDWGASIPTAVP